MACNTQHIWNVCRDRKQNIKKVAESCNVEYYGWLNIFPFKTFNAKKYTCIRLLSQLPTHVNYVPFQKCVNEFIKIINEDFQSQEVQLSFFTGLPEAGLMGILYLLESCNNCCAYGADWNMLIMLLQAHTTEQLEDIIIPWQILGFVWKKENKKFSLTYNNTKPRCESKRFLITLLTIQTSSYELHANILIYDCQLHILERFDPYETPISHTKLRRMDKKIKKVYVTDWKLPVDMYLNSSKNMFEQNVFLQQVQEKEIQTQSSIDPHGFCQPWVFVYAYLRLQLPDIYPKLIPQMIVHGIRKNNSSMTAFVRNYSKFLLSTSQNLFVSMYKKKEHQKFLDIRIPILIGMLNKIALYCMYSGGNRSLLSVKKRSMRPVED
jgi:hypothetical protein